MMKKELVEFCRSIDIEHVGIAPAEPYIDFGEIWAKQLSKGHISGFEEKDINKRINPELTLQGIKSVIVCLFPYFSGNHEGANLSKSAYSIDYHLIVMEKLKLIGEFLKKSIDGFEYKAFVDNGPLSDRHLAYKAGLGFWGINSHLITDQYGSYVFIGYILNNYPFEPDIPQSRTCLQCMECVKKCPGQCIAGDFSINPQRCKSYITQKKGGLAAEDEAILKQHELIWGCDVCQDVCPHNRNAQVTIINEFKSQLKHRINADELKQMSNKEFQRQYGNRAFSWRGKGVLIRNNEVIHGPEK